MEAFILSNVHIFADKPWFTTLIASCVVLLAMAFMSKTGIEILTNIKKAVSILVTIAPPRRSLKDLFEAEQNANNELDTLAQSYGANRACLALFQNGEKSANGGVCFFGLTVKAEGTNGGYPKIGHRIHKIPLRVYGDWPMKLTYNANISVPDISTVAESHPDAYFLLAQNSVKSFYAVPVGSYEKERGEMVFQTDGCIFLEYCDKHRELEEVDLIDIRSKAQAIYTKLHEVNNQ